MNNSQTPDPRKEICDELAELLHSDDGRRTARLMQLMGLTGSEDLALPPQGAREAQEPQAISIWRPRRIDGEECFERPEPMVLGDHYAAQRVLRVRKDPATVRVAFFGESVAAGYLYAPHTTPARVLDQQLRSMGGERFEVVDLARTNESLSPLARTIEASLQLDPDVLVIFIGNNWNLLETPDASPHAPSIAARQRYALALRQEGIRGAVERARRQLEHKARGILRQIAESTRDKPVVLVVPEVNLSDWQNRQPTPWLAGERTALWYVLYDEATAALERGDDAAALVASQKMLELDEGVCPTSYRLLGRALVGLDRADEARRAFRAEIDANAYASLAFLGAPQRTSQARTLLLEAAREHGWTAVDLPTVFAEQTACELPGRRLFLDYCHFSLEGIGLAMAAVASAVLRQQGRPRSQTEILDQAAIPELASQHEALAYLGAALHTAHRMVGEKREQLEYWCRRALAVSPEIAKTLCDVVTVRCSGLPAVLNAAQQRNLKSPHRLLLQHGWRWEALDADVLLAIRTVMAEIGQPIDEMMDHLLIEHHEVSRRGAQPGQPGVELSRMPYLWEPLERLYLEAMELADLTSRAFYRAFWPRSSFCLICDGKIDIELNIIARLPVIDGARERLNRQVDLLLNGRSQSAFELESTWGRARVRLPASALERGLNRLTLHWPAPQPAGAIALARAIERLEEGLEADLHPIFGEIFTIRARA